MSDKLQALQDDITYLKQMVEEGRAPPLIGGSIMVLAGLVFGAASIVHWAIATGRITLSPWSYAVVWVGALAVFLAGLAVIHARANRTAVGANGARAIGVAWSAVGWTIFTMALCIGVVGWRAQSAIPTFLFPSLILALYGLAWTIAGAITGRSWIRLTALASFASALVMAWFATQPEVFLLYAAALMLLAVAPGLAMMRLSRPARG